MNEERANCTVLALSAAAAIEYELAHRIAADAGRVSSRGFRSEKLIAEAKARGLTFRKLRMGPRTLRKFIKERPVGRFYVKKRGHALAVIDGVPSESRTSLGSIIIDAWQFTAVSA